MIKGIYTAASGMINMLSANDNLASNLANINTPGFKQGITLFKSFAPLLIEKLGAHGDFQHADPTIIGKLSPGANLSAIAFDFTQGEIKTTNNKSDMAIKGDGFFEVKTVAGKTAYTRDGSFVVDPDGYLTTKEGDKVMGKDNKPILIGKKTTDFIVESDGTVLVNVPSEKTKEQKEAAGQDDQKEPIQEMVAVGQIKIVEFENKYGLMKVGNSQFIDSGAAKAKAGGKSVIMQGALEASNANVITTMVKSIEGMRTYETLSKIVEVAGGNLEKAVNQLGKI